MRVEVESPVYGSLVLSNPHLPPGRGPIPPPRWRSVGKQRRVARMGADTLLRVWFSREWQWSVLVRSGDGTWRVAARGYRGVESEMHGRLYAYAWGRCFA